ncbi:MAG: ChaN family lipoprotein, partial [Acidobacteria bacterium]|nr:ChaN family lipoprotein [Acidobacteriota bacterium]
PMMYTKQRLKEETALKRAAVRRILKDIRKLHSVSSRKYIDEFTSEFKTYQAVCEPERILDEAQHSNLIWIGDYHALYRSQEFAAQFIRDLAAHNPNLAVAVEPVFSRQQKILDRWSAGKLSEPEFLNRIRYEEEWGCDWSGYKLLFQAAHDLKIPIYGVDCHPRHDMRSIGRRDQSVARRIVRLIEKHPERTLVVVFGESHLASNHLPRRVGAILERRGITRDQMTLLQNIDTIYWELQEQGLEDACAVHLDNRRYCVFNATPIEKYESFRQYLHQCAGEDSSDEWAHLAQTLVDVMMKFLDLKKDQDLVNYLPVLDAHSVSEAAEDFARFMHQAFRGDVDKRLGRSAHDQFFVVVLESALGYFCSKLLDPSRDGIEALTVRVLNQIEYTDQFARAVAWLVDPAKRPSAQHFEIICEAVEAKAGSQKTMNTLAELLGYALGRRLYQGYLRARISRRDIQALFQDPLNKPNRPLECYIELSQAL